MSDGVQGGGVSHVTRRPGAGVFPMSHGVQGPGASNITRRLGLGCLSHVVFPCRTDNFAGSQVAQDSLAHGAGVAERAAEAAAN